MRLTQHAVERFMERVRPKGLFDQRPEEARRVLQELLNGAKPAGLDGEPALRARYGDAEVFFRISPDQLAVPTVILRPISISKESYAQRQASRRPSSHRPVPAAARSPRPAARW